MSFASHISSGIVEIGLWTNTSTLVEQRQPDGTVNNNAAHHVAAVRNGNDLAVYIDGSVVETGIGYLTGDVTVTGTAGPTIAARLNATTERFNGTLDEVAVYTTALSSTRIAAHYTAGTT